MVDVLLQHSVVSCQHQLLAAATSLLSGGQSRELKWLCPEPAGAGPQICKKREAFQPDVLTVAVFQRVPTVKGFITKKEIGAKVILCTSFILFTMPLITRNASEITPDELAISLNKKSIFPRSVQD